MENRHRKNLIIIITYIVVAILFIINFKQVLGFTGKVLGLFNSFFAGIAIAFILNNPCMATENFINKNTNIKNKSLKRGISITVTYLVLFLLLFY